MSEDERESLNWSDLNLNIPFITPEEAPEPVDTVVYQDGPRRVLVTQPGRHWNQTYRPGGDFHVQVDSPTAQTLAREAWQRHGFSHAALFDDFEIKSDVDPEGMRTRFAPALVEVIAEGVDPETFAGQLPDDLPGLEPLIGLIASQCLALAEHRRYRQYEPATGRCLPLRIALGIIFGCWDASRASNYQRRGRGALAILRGVSKSREPSLQEVLGRPLAADAACEDEATDLARAPRT